MAEIYDRVINNASPNTSDSIILGRIKPGATILECGCATGYMTHYLKEEFAASVSIIEYNEKAFNIAKQFAVDGICADLDDTEKWSNHFKGQQFDYILFADVLEHLRNPEQVLRRAGQLLKDDGEVLASIPNVAHADVVLNLYHNQWNYKKFGLLDDTHIHFWGPDNIRKLYASTDLTPVEIDCSIVPPLQSEQANSQIAAVDMAIVDSVCRRDRSDLYQFVVAAKKSEYVLKHRVECIDRYEERHKAYGMFPECCKEYERNKTAIDEDRKRTLEIHQAVANIDHQTRLNEQISNDRYKKIEEDIEHIDAYYKNIINELQERNKAIEEKCTQLSELNSSFAEMLKQQKKDAADTIFRLQNTQRIMNDLQYVMQNSRWYQSAMHHIQHPSMTYRFMRSIRSQGIHATLQKGIKKILKRIYHYSKGNTSMRHIYRSLKKICPQLGNLVSAIKQIEYKDYVSNGMQFSAMDNWCGELRRTFSEPPLVSVIVPNYNHAQYLKERLESIYNQTYSNFEVILLDDCSSDNSRDILMEYARKYPEKTIVDFNENNGGRVFKQWNKGIKHAHGKLIWIAESDDWCELSFLEKMVPQFEYESVMLAFCRSVFMQEGSPIWTMEEYLHDIPSLNFDKPFIATAHNIVQSAFAIKNIVPNVSSAMFRNTGEIPPEITDIWNDIKLCGDWLFYLHTIRGGCIAYTNETTNYYRIHSNSTSLKIQKTADYYKEQEVISKFVKEQYNVDDTVFEKVLDNLKAHYRYNTNNQDAAIVCQNYDLNRIIESGYKRKPNVIMCCFSLQIGGGETYPIVLANEMKRQGVAVTFLNFNLENYSEQIRDMLRPDIPLVTLSNPDFLGGIICQLGAEIIHSHHASVDNMVSVWLNALPTQCKQIVTLHGMYEAIAKKDCLNAFNNLKKTCSKFIYIADKNLERINELGFSNRFDLTKLGNGLPEIPISPISRKSLGIEKDDFVLCLVSRALESKGWKEAVDSVLMANETSKRKIHLILVGEGEMYDQLKNLNNPLIHTVGQKSNVRDYFAASDMGFLPSRYKGESFPLVVIESLLSGKPVLASDIGEVRYQLTTSNDKIAGVLFELDNWKIDVQKLSKMIVEIANNQELYGELCNRVPNASKKFNIEKIVKKHLEIYNTALGQKEKDR